MKEIMSTLSVRALVLFHALFLFSGAPLHAANDTAGKSPEAAVDSHKVWQKVPVDFTGPALTESRETFFNYRLQVRFTHSESGKAYIIPGYFAADGDAANSGASKGHVWRVNFVPDTPGTWKYTASFRRGVGIAINLDPLAGQSAGAFDGRAGELNVAPAALDMNAKDFAFKGMLKYAQKRYLQFGGTKDYFLKGGAGSPENFLAFSDFDNSYDLGGTIFPALGEDQLHAFGPHLGDWQVGDPTWRNGQGKAIIGAVNYLSLVGVNAQYLLVMNVEGDGQEIWPWLNPADHYVFDVSKLDQWGMVFDHMDRRGIVKDMLLSENENQNLFEAMEGGKFAPARKLFYREMVARYGHLLGLSWNLGEEIGTKGNSGEEPWNLPNSAEQTDSFARYISAIDAYDHPIVAHNWPDTEEATYAHLLGKPYFHGISLQAHEDYSGRIEDWTKKSAAAGRPWIIAVDEPLGWEFGARPDADDPNQDIARKTVLWPVLLAGSAGIDWYFGWQNNALTSDLSNEDMSSRDTLWKQTKIALDVMRNYMPFTEMAADFQLAAGQGVSVFSKPGEIHAIYIPEGGTVDLNLQSDNGSNIYAIHWINPVTGKPAPDAPVLTTSSKAKQKLEVTDAMPGADITKDWLLILRSDDDKIEP